jgi:hypothetical protein
MDQEREDYADSPEKWPPDDLRVARPLWFASHGFAVVAGGLVLTVIAGQFFISDPIKAWWGWGVLLSLVALPFLLIGFAAHRVSRAVHGRRIVRVCGWIVVGLGVVMVLSPLHDVYFWMDRGRMPARPALMVFGFHLVAGQWAAAVVAAAASWWVTGPDGRAVPSPPRTRTVLVILAWTSTAIPLLAAVVVLGLWTGGSPPPPGKSRLRNDDHRAIGVCLLITQTVGLVLAAVSMAGIRDRRGSALIVPGAILGIVLNLSCLGVAFVELVFLAPNWSMR